MQCVNCGFVCSDGEFHSFGGCPACCADENGKVDPNGIPKVIHLPKRKVVCSFNPEVAQSVAKSKDAYIAAEIQPGIITWNDLEYKIKLPDGCIGVALVFDSEEAVKQYFTDRAIKSIPVTFIEELS